MKRKRKQRAAARGQEWSLAEGLVWLLVLIVPVAFSSALQESFRLPKRLIAETLALASVVALAWRLDRVARVDWRAALRRPAVLAGLPLLAVAATGLATSAHPLHVRGALASLAIATVAMIAWHLGFRLEELRRLVAGLVVPAAVLALVAVLQFHGWLRLFAFEDPITGRLSITSLAGGPFDLAAFLALPILIAQGALWRPGRYRWAWAAGLALGLYALAVTQTLTVLVAVGAASVVLWGWLLPVKRFVAALALAVVVVGALVAGVAPLRGRLVDKVASVRAGDWNAVLTGRLDGWRAARRMVAERPWTGVGLGAFRAEFAPTKLDMVADGTRFYRRQHQPFFGNAHSEALEVAATLGWPGVAAALWALVLLGRETVRAARRRAADAEGRIEAAVAVAALLALAIMAATSFPLHLAHVTYAYLLLTAAIFTAAAPATPDGERAAA